MCPAEYLTDTTIKVQFHEIFDPFLKPKHAIWSSKVKLGLNGFSKCFVFERDSFMRFSTAADGFNGQSKSIGPQYIRCMLIFLKLGFHVLKKNYKCSCCTVQYQGSMLYPLKPIAALESIMRLSLERKDQAKYSNIGIFSYQKMQYF